MLSDDSLTNLAGLVSAKEFEVRIQHDRFILRAEGRYNLVYLRLDLFCLIVLHLTFSQGVYVQNLPLHPPVEETAALLQFVKKKALLKVLVAVLASNGL